MTTRETVSGSLGLLSTLGVMGALQTLGPRYEREASITLAPQFGPTKELLEKIAAGAIADLAVLTAEAVDRLIAEGVMQPGSKVDLARSLVGIAVNRGARQPDIGTTEAFRQALLDATSIVYSRAGASGIFFVDLIQRLGIADAVNAKAIVVPNGFTAERLVSGEAEIAVQQISELMTVPGVDIVGPLPTDIQQVTMFSAGIFSRSNRIGAARAFVEFLAGRAASAVFATSGLDPVGGQ